MDRELRNTLLIMLAVLILSAPIIFADAPQTQGTASYLALVFQLQPSATPTPIPTPIPPPISSLVIQRHQMSSDYSVDTSREITNQEAATTYANPAAALVAFAQQGRETSWFIIYTSNRNLAAIGVSDQVYRYLTPEGATQGQAYVVADRRAKDRTWQPVALTIPGFPSINLQRTFKSGSTTFRQFLISAQVGRYITDVQVIGVDGEITLQIASNYAQRAIATLFFNIPDGPPTPTLPFTREAAALLPDMKPVVRQYIQPQ